MPEQDDQVREPRAVRKSPSGKNSLVPSATGIRRAAMDRLARREHCRHELEQKLCRQFPDATAAIGPVLDQLEHEGLLSDTRFTVSFLRSRAARGQGPLRIAAELRQHQLALPPDQCIDWLTRARDARSRRFGDALPAEAVVRAKQMAFLQRRGFPLDICRAACQQVRDS